MAQIDDIAGTMSPYDSHVKNPDETARRIKDATGADTVIVDVNDLGNDDECTPIVLLKPVRAQTGPSCVRRDPAPAPRTLAPAPPSRTPAPSPPPRPRS